MRLDLPIVAISHADGRSAGGAVRYGPTTWGSTEGMDAATNPGISREAEAEDLRLRTLMRSAQDGDRIAYEALLRACLPRIRRRLQRRGVDPVLVDDVIQDVLLTIHRARQTYDPSRPFAVWLAMITDRRAIDAARRHHRHAMHEVSSPDAYEAHADDGGDPQPFVTTIAIDRIRGSIVELPTAQREAVERLSLRQQSLTEAAEETGRSVGSLKVNLHRGLKALRALLNPEGRS